MTDRFSSREELKFHPEAESQGRLARLDGFSLNRNPHPTGSWLHTSWAAGWADADAGVKAGDVTAEALTPLAGGKEDEKRETLAEFYERWQHIDTEQSTFWSDRSDGFMVGFAPYAWAAIKAEVERKAARPPIVCLCGSTRFMDEYFEQGWEETLVGKIVLSVGVCKHTDADGGHGGEMLGPAVCSRLDELHLRKIDLADEVLILNVGGYIGESTARELAYARKTGKTVRFLEPEKLTSQAGGEEKDE